MKTFKIVNGDLVFDGQGNLVIVKGKEEIGQSIERILTTNIGEWFLNLEHGLDYSAIQGKGRDEEGIQLALAEAILQEERVSEVERIDLFLDKDRHLKINVTVRLQEGDNLQISEVIDIG